MCQNKFQAWDFSQENVVIPVAIESGMNQKRFADVAQFDSHRKQLSRRVPMPERMGLNANESGFIFPFV